MGEGTEVVMTLAEQIEEYGEAFLSLATKFLGLFKIWPLNAFLIAGFGFIAIAYVKSLKRTAK